MKSVVKRKNMEDYRQIINNAERGQIVPIVKQIDINDPMDFFAKISDYGRAGNSCLFESKEYLKDSSALSFGTARPSLYLTGAGREFTIKALNNTGKRIINFLSSKERFNFCEEVKFDEQQITGTIKGTEKIVDEQTRRPS